MRNYIKTGIGSLVSFSLGTTLAYLASMVEHKGISIFFGASCVVMFISFFVFTACTTNLLLKKSGITFQ